MPKPITRNTLFYGDNLPILREHIADELVDLIYLDPPFNSSRSYNVLFKAEGRREAAAQKLNRKWIGIDVTHLSISLMKYRLKDSFGLVEKKNYNVVGEPEDTSSAKQLAKDDRYQFQWWALSLVGAKPLGGDGGKEGKKGSDKDYPRIQILTIDDLLNGKEISMPPSAFGTFKQAEKVKKKEGKQGELGI